MTNAPYRPPAPDAAKPLASLLRVVLRGERDLLSLVPDAAYREVVTPLGYSRRSILLVNAPEFIPAILANADGNYPKNDLMVGALEELVGNSVFVSDGAQWRRQRRMIEPAFSHMRIGTAFPAMAAAIGEAEQRFDALVASAKPFSLDAAMSFLTADIISRTIFSKPLEGGVGRDVFHAFAIFEKRVASVDLAQLILGKPFAKVRQPAHVRAACRTIRDHLDCLLTERAAADGLDDIAGAIMAARDPETGEGFTREELIDQIGVFFLAGHETTASALTWTFFILSQQPAVVQRMRAEIDEIAGEGEIGFEQAKRLVFTRNVFREALRLYPPITFLPRVAAADTVIAGRKVKRGAMIMVAPWTIHRNERLWKDAAVFDPDRFSSAAEQEQKPGTYIPFGLGPRVCVGAAFAMIESVLILARLIHRYDIGALDPASVRPVARLTTRPAAEIMCRARRRAHG